MKNLLLKWCFIGCLMHSTFSVVANTEVTDFQFINKPIAAVELAISDTNFQSTKHIKFGYTNEIHWVRFPLMAANAGKYVSLNFRCIDYVSFYFVRNGIAHDSIVTGYLQPMASRALNISRFVMPLPEDANSSDWVYLKLQKKEGTLRTKVFIQDFKTLEQSIRKEERVIMFFLGMSLLMIIFSLAYYIQFKLNLFLWYIFFLISFSALQLSNYGYGSLYIWGDNYWLSNSTRSFWQLPTLFFGLLFSCALLKVNEFCSEKINKLFQIIRYILGALLLLVFVPLPAYPWRFSFYAIHHLCLLVTLILLVYGSIKAIQKRHVAAYYFVFGEMVSFSVLVYITTYNFNVIADLYYMEYAIFYGGMIAMSAGIISMVAYTRSMHQIKIREEVFLYKKAESKPLNEEELKKTEEVFEQVNTLFENEKLYLDAHLNVESLAEMANIQAHLISKAINAQSGKHFFDYVNSFRIEAAKKMLEDEELLKLYSISGIATQCGFSNKTSFNKAFKKFTGKTPSEYRESPQNGVNE